MTLATLVDVCRHFHSHPCSSSSSVKAATHQNILPVISSLKPSVICVKTTLFFCHCCSYPRAICHSKSKVRRTSLLPLFSPFTFTTVGVNVLPACTNVRLNGGSIFHCHQLFSLLPHLFFRRAFSHADVVIICIVTIECAPHTASVPPLTTAHHLDDAFHITSHVSQTPVVGVVGVVAVAVPQSSSPVATHDSSSSSSRTFFAGAASPGQHQQQLLRQPSPVLTHKEADGRQEVVPVWGRVSFASE